MTGGSGARRQVTVVTGGAGGLGLATVRRLLDDGHEVALWDRDAESLDTARRTLGNSSGLLVVAVDVRLPESVAEAARLTARELEPPSALVAVAGTSGPFMPYLDYPLEAWEDVIAVNMTGTHLCVSALLPAMIERGWGRVVTVSSMAGKEGNPQMAGYSAAKAGLIGYTKAVGRELATSGVLVNCITPALFETDLMRRQWEEFPEAMDAMIGKIPMKRPGQPDEFAAMAAWLVSDECSFTTGMVFDVSGGRATY
jgi:NAD(P)-dependent dehydrogenase (short-subunit alcohol dehydrogenase family)